MKKDDLITDCEGKSMSIERVGLTLVLNSLKLAVIANLICITGILPYEFWKIWLILIAVFLYKEIKITA